MLAKKEGSAPSREASLQGCLGNAVYRDQPPVGGRTWKWRSKTNDCGYSWRLRRLLGFRWWPFGTIKLVLPLIKDTFADANLVRSLCFDPKPEIARISHGLDAYPEFFLPPVKITNKSHVSRNPYPSHFCQLLCREVLHIADLCTWSPLASELVCSMSHAL